MSERGWEERDPFRIEPKKGAKAIEGARVMLQGCTALHEAIIRGLLDLVDPLLEGKGRAVIDARNNVSMGPAGWWPRVPIPVHPHLVPASLPPFLVLRTSLTTFGPQPVTRCAAVNDH